MADDTRSPDVKTTDNVHSDDAQEGAEVDALSSTSTNKTIGEIPPPNQQVVRRTSSLTIENVKKLEEAANKEDKESEQRPVSPTKSYIEIQNSRTSSPLAPLRSSLIVSRDIEGSGSRQDSLTNLVTSSEIRTGSPKPLPPIKRNIDDACDEDNIASVAANEKTSHSTLLNQRDNQPRILSFRRELPESSETVDDSVVSNRSAVKTPDSSVSKKTERSVSFKQVHDERPSSKGSERQKGILKSPAVREIIRTKDKEGQEYVQVSIATETEWSWFESMKLVGKENLQDDLESKDQIVEDDIGQKSRSHQSSFVSMGSDATEVTFIDHQANVEPWKSRSGYEGLPPLQLDSESEFSDDDIASDFASNLELVPNIGPPLILKYQRESEKAEIKVKNPVILEEPRMSPDSLALSEEIDGIFSGQCEFCFKDIQPFPSPEMMEAFSEKDLFCCPDYQKFVEFTITHSPSAEFSVDLIDVAPHAPFGSKQARRAAKERAAQRMREREMARQKAAGANQANFYAFARQMKTINYSLSSQKYIDDGWTLRPATADSDESKTPDIFEPEPIDPPAFRNMKQGLSGVNILEKTYEDGKSFLIMFPDGTGTVFYPSGHPAIMILSTEKGKYTYIVHDDRPGTQIIQAVFEPSGQGTCYHPNGVVKLNMNQFGGVFLDGQGARKKRWTWKDHTTHVHAPPFQPICFAISKYVSLRCLAQDQITLLYSCNKRSVRFNVGVKLKLIAPENIPLPDIDEDALFISEVRTYVRLVVDKVGNLLKFSKSPKLENLRPPLRIQHDVIKNERLKGKKVDRKVDKKHALVTVN
ncbi:glutamate-rich protein 6-like [Antedon mediterranea]|uniref:glutamate-rich protein 6-like n=1 Tax=Antedon mediterranea TaxID=105859 RepID=UPI003AF84EEF